MSDAALLEDLIDRLCQQQNITAEDVLDLRRLTYPDGVIGANEAAAVFQLDHACPDKDPSWVQFYVEALTDYFLWQSEPRGYLSEPQSKELISTVVHDGRVDSVTELELLINIIHHAKSVPEELALFVLGAVRDSILNPDTAVYGRDRQAGVITPFDVEILHRVIYAPGSPGGFTVSQEEAELLFDLNDATSSAENSPAWTEFFVKAVVNFLMFPRRAPVVADAAVARRREAEPSGGRGIGGVLRGLTASMRRMDIPFTEAFREFDPFGSAVEREERAKESARVQEALAREAINGSEVQWLIERIRRDDNLHPNERALLTYIKTNAAVIDPSLNDFLAKAAV